VSLQQTSYSHVTKQEENMCGQFGKRLHYYGLITFDVASKYRVELIRVVNSSIWLIRLVWLIFVDARPGQRQF